MSDGGAREQQREPSATGVGREGVEETLADWPPAVAESVARALETAQEQHETKAGERWRKVAARLLAEQDARAQEIERQRQSLTGILTESLGRVSRGVESAIAPWVLGWSRALWRVVMMNVAVTVALTPNSAPALLVDRAARADRAALASCEAALTNYKGAWDAMTPAQQQENNRRRQGQAQETGP